jgi:hypothetical protein
MKKQPGKMIAAKKTGLRTLAPTRKSEASDITPVVGLPQGPRGGKPANRVDRAIALSFRVSAVQYRKLCEARVDANTTMQGLIVRALASYWQKENGTAF